MDDTTFWAVIAQVNEGTAEHGLPTAGRADALATWVHAAGDDELRGFHTALVAHRNRAYRWDLWAAGYLALGGMSDDAFFDFRTWLVLHGRDTFERVLAEPDTLADLSWDDEEEEFGWAERAGNLAVGEWEDRTGTVMTGPADEPADPVGEPFPEEDDDWFRATLPRLASRHLDPG